MDSGFAFPIDNTEYFFQTEAIARVNVVGKAGNITAKKTLGLSFSDLKWRTSSNEMVDVTAIQFLEFAIAMDEFVESHYQDSWAI